MLAHELMLGLHQIAEGLTKDETRGFSGDDRQGRMFLLCCSPKGHKLLLITRNNSGFLAIDTRKFHDRF